MSKRNFFHLAVKKALEKEEWTIVANPLWIEAGGINVTIDLAADRLIAAERLYEKVKVE